MKKKISIILTIIWMIVIYLMSSSNSTVSNQQSGYIVNFIANLFNISNLELLSYIIRKIAHLIEYTILGLLVENTIKNYHQKSYITLIICIIYSITDEFHQSLVPGRSPQIKDIIIDTIGSLLGIVIYHLILKIIKKYQSKKKIIKQ